LRLAGAEDKRLSALLVLPFGLAIGLALGLVGGGGSVLAVPVLVYVLGEPVKDATTASLLIVGATALLGALAYARTGHVRIRLGLAFGAAGAAGALAGTALNRAVSGRSILAAFALLLVVSAAAMLRTQRETRRPEVAARGRALWTRILPAGVGSGVLTGFFGVGGGFVILPALTLLLALPLAAAVGTSLLVISVTSASALAAHLSSGHLDWLVASSFAASASLAAVAASQLRQRFSSRRLTQLFAALVACVALLLIGENVRSLL
jgi:uncharacterized membrane protein YfcA